MIALFLAPIYLALNFYLLRWIFCWAGACHEAFSSARFRLPAAFLYSFLALSPLTGFLAAGDPWRRIFKLLGNYWLGTLAYLLMAVLLLDFLRLLTGLPAFSKSPSIARVRSAKRTLFFSGLFTLCLVVSVSVFGIFHAKRLYVREYPITIEKACGLPGLRIALIADLHLGYNSSTEQVRSIVEKINAENPDIICIAGDIFDNEYEAIEDPEAAAEILASLQSRYGTYACFGNHDVSEKILAGFTFSQEEALDEDPRFRSFLDSARIQLLEDETVLIGGSFYLSGIKDPSKAKKEGDSRLPVSQLIEALDKSKPILIMDHQPGDLSQTAAAGADLALSGHTHDGQLFPVNLIVQFLWENSCGIKKIDSMYSVVTSGAGVWGPAMRVGTDSEIVILDIKFSGP